MYEEVHDRTATPSYQPSNSRKFKYEQFKAARGSVRRSTRPNRDAVIPTQAHRESLDTSSSRSGKGAYEEVRDRTATPKCDVYKFSPLIRGICVLYLAPSDTCWKYVRVFLRRLRSVLRSLREARRGKRIQVLRRALYRRTSPLRFR